MSAPKTLILNIAENPHIIDPGISSSGGGASTDEIRAIVDSKLKDYVKLSDVINDLLTVDPTKPLSAAQGHVLQTQIDILKADITKIVVDGIGIAAGCGVKVTVEDGMTLISISIDENSPLAFNENNQLFIQWSENQ